MVAAYCYRFSRLMALRAELMELAVTVAALQVTASSKQAGVEEVAVREPPAVPVDLLQQRWRGGAELLEEIRVSMLVETVATEKTVPPARLNPTA
jgi:hypothetical protein